MQYRLLFVFPWLAIFAAIAAGGELAVETNFPGGSAQDIQVDQGKRSIRLNPKHYQGKGWACWWYIKVTGVNPGETISVDVGEAPWATPDRAAFSLDNSSWLQTSPGTRDRRRIVYRQQVNGRECWFAWGPPFLPSDAKSLVENVAEGSTFATAFELCRTRGDRSVPALRIEQPNDEVGVRLGIWVQARQHAWESGSSWVCQGFVEWLVSDDPRAENLRKLATVTIVPIMDVDSVAIGAGGKTQDPQDHNRDWSDNPHWPAVKAAMAEIKAADARGEFDLFIDLHNPGANAKQPFFYVAPRKQLSKVSRHRLENFLAAVQLEMTGPLKFTGQVEESGAGYDKEWKKISKNWVSENTREGVVAVTLETAWNTPHSQTVGYRIVGKQLGIGIARYFRTSRLAAE